MALPLRRSLRKREAPRCSRGAIVLMMRVMRIMVVMVVMRIMVVMVVMVVVAVVVRVVVTEAVGCCCRG